MKEEVIHQKRGRSVLAAVPNILTGSRFFLTLWFLWLLLEVDRQNISEHISKLDWAFVLFVIAGITDILDGPIARRLNVTSSFGRRFDPLMDKILVGGGFIVLTLFGAELSGLGWWMVVVILCREVLVSTVRNLSESHGQEFAATWAGKVKMFLQSFTIGTIIIYMGHLQGQRWAIVFRDVCIWIAVLFTMASVIIYWPRMKRIFQRR